MKKQIIIPILVVLFIIINTIVGHNFLQKDRAAIMYDIGCRYYYGQGAVAQDYAKAMEWYEKAAEAGSPDAMYQIGYLYYHGQGVNQDDGKAKEWYEKSAAAE